MADESAAQISAPATILHDPLPESTWFWRRCFIFALTAISAAGVWLMVQAIRDLAANNPTLAVPAFQRIIGWLLLFDWCVVTYYLVAPTGEQITRWVQTAGMLKNGVALFGTATTQTPDTTAQTTVAAGKPAPAPAPIATAPPAPPIDAAPTSRK